MVTQKTHCTHVKENRNISDKFQFCDFFRYEHMPSTDQITGYTQPLSELPYDIITMVQEYNSGPPPLKKTVFTT